MDSDPKRSSKTVHNIVGLQQMDDHNSKRNNANVMDSSDLRKKDWVICVCPTTGGQFKLSVPTNLTVEGLKTLIGNKLRLPMDKINLLYKDRILKTGPLTRHGVIDGCKFTLLPNVESGLASQKTDHSIMQVLENLTDKQVNEFLAGKAPLTLAMRLGDHMMFLQLQLSSSPFAMQHVEPTSHHHYHHPHHNHHRHHGNNPVINHFQPKIDDYTHREPQHYSHYRHHHHQHYEQQQRRHHSKHHRTDKSHCSEKQQHNLRNNSSILSTHASSNVISNESYKQHLSPSSTSSQHMFKSPPEPTRLLDLSVSDCDESSVGSVSSGSDGEYSSNCSTPVSTPPTSPPSSPIANSIPSISTSSKATDSQRGWNSNPHHNDYGSHDYQGKQQPPTQLLNTATTPILDAATKTLQQKLLELKHMSKITKSGSSPLKEEVEEDNKEETGRKGAVINSMHHVGKGVFSGTFSGTLNPAVHDGEGKPRKRLSTIVQILNDLLGAAPEGKLPLSSSSSLSHVERRQRVRSCSSRSCNNSCRKHLHRFPHTKAEDKQNRIERENQIMKDKVEQVQMMLQQRRQKRKAKREANASPYGWLQSSTISHMKHTSDSTVGINDMETELSTDMNEDNASFTGGKLKPEAVFV